MNEACASMYNEFSSCLQLTKLSERINKNIAINRSGLMASNDLHTWL